MAKSKPQSAAPDLPDEVLIRQIASMAGTDFTIAPGEEYRVTREVAERYAEAGIAKIIDPAYLAWVDAAAESIAIRVVADVHDEKESSVETPPFEPEPEPDP